MQTIHDKVLRNYAEAYRKLYNRNPKDLRTLDSEWVVVNGARIRISELEELTVRLRREYQESIADRRTMISRLVKWLKGKDLS